MHGQAALELLHLGGGSRLERAVLNIVELNEIHMAKRALAKLNESVHLGVVVIHTIDHGVLIGGTAPRFLGVGLDSFVQAREGELLYAGHKLIASRLDRRVK